jgi:hypothetical protein
LDAFRQVEAFAAPRGCEDIASGWLKLVTVDSFGASHFPELVELNGGGGRPGGSPLS